MDVRPDNVTSMSAGIMTAYTTFYGIVIDDIARALTADNVITPEIEATLDGLKENLKTHAAATVEKKPRKQPRITGYNVYMREHRSEVQREFPDLNSQQLVTHMSSSWKKYPEEFRKKFNERAAQLQAERETSSA